MEKLCTQLVNQLMDAAVDNPAEARRLLSAYPGLLAACGQFGETALHLLAVEGYTAAVRFLAEAGADVNARAELGDPPLNDVAVLGNDEIAEILLAHGHPNATSDTRDNALHAGVASGNPRLVDLLLSAGADPRYQTDLGESIFDALPTDAAKREAVLEVLRRHGVLEGAALTKV